MKKYLKILFAVTLLCIAAIGQAQNGVPAVILPSPAQYTLSGGGTYCPSSQNGLPIFTNGSQVGTTIGLYNGSYPGGSQTSGTTGTGNSITFFNQTLAGNYYAIATNSYGCETMMLGTVIINIDAQPVVNVTSNDSLTGCGTVTASLSTPAQTGCTYQWKHNGVNITGATNNTYVATVTSGSEVFSCTVTNGTGCESSDFIIMTANPLPQQFTITPSTLTFCQGIGGYVIMPTTITGTSYQLKRFGVNYGTPIMGNGSQHTWTGLPDGSYTVEATIIATGCTNMMIGTAMLTMDPLPIAANVIAGPTTVCSNSVVTYTTSNISYADSCIWSVPNGATILNGQGTTSITVHMGSTSGAVGVYGKNDCGSGQPTTINVTVNPAPIFTTTANPADICAGSSTTLSVNTTASAYAWSGGGNTQSITVSPVSTTTYQVTVTGSNTCTATGNVTVNVHSLPAVSLNLTEDNFCMDVNSAVISGGLPAGGTYSGGCIFGSNTIYPPVSGANTWVITYVYTDTYGCSAGATDLLTINPLPVVSFYNITGQINTDTPPFDLTNFVMPIGGVFSGPGMVGSMFDPATAGAGTHMLTYTYEHPITGCSASQIQYVTVSGISGIEDAASAGIIIYPNPTDGVLNIALGDINGVDVQLFDLQGKMMYSGTETVIDLTGVPAGIYTLRITTEDGIYHSKVVKN